MSKPVRRSEEQVVGAVRVEVERARPLVALQARTGDGIGPNARGRQEHGVTVGASEQTTVHAVKRCPARGTILVKFFLLLSCGHAPRRSPVDACRIVLWIQLRLVINKAVVTEGTFGAVLRRCGCAAVAPLVVAPVVVVLGRGLAPGKVVAVFLGRIGTNVTRCP